LTRARLREVGPGEGQWPECLKRGGQFAIKRNAVQRGSTRRKSRKAIETFSIIHFPRTGRLGTLKRIGSLMSRAHYWKGIHHE
jgi:hypothetical protein